MRDTTVKRLVKVAAKRTGLEDTLAGGLQRHSMRVGAAQDLLCAGQHTILMMRAGGWKSINVLVRYLDHAEHNVWS